MTTSLFRSGQALWRTQLKTTWDADRFDLADWLAAQGSVPMLASADAQAGHDLCGHPVQDGFSASTNPIRVWPRRRSPNSNRWLTSCAVAQRRPNGHVS